MWEFSHTMGVISSVWYCNIWRCSRSWNALYLGVLESTQSKYLYGELFTCRLHIVLRAEFLHCVMLSGRGSNKKGPIHSSDHITGHPLPSGTLSWRWHSPYEERSKQLLNPSLGIPSGPPSLKRTCKYEHVNMWICILNIGLAGGLQSPTVSSTIRGNS